jgi:L-fuculose-phosphate aldolase
MTDTLSWDKTALVERAQAQMKRHLAALEAGTRQQVAWACQVLFAEGHASGLAGQVTARAEKPGQFYTQRMGLGFDEITDANMLLVDEDLNVLEGEGMANPATRFHVWIYRARPQVNSIVHTHPPHACALSMTGQPLKVAQMDMCMLYDDVAWLPQWPGVPVGNSEGEIISAALGDKRAALLAHHGIVAACTTVEEACVIAVQCERAARLQLLAQAAGPIAELDPELAREAHDWTLQPQRTRANFAYLVRHALRHRDPQ